MALTQTGIQQLVKPSSDISVIFVYQSPVRSAVSQKCFSHFIFSLGSQAPVADKEEKAKLGVCLGLPSHLALHPCKANKNNSKKKKSPKQKSRAQQILTSSLLSPPQLSPLTIQTCCLWMLRQRRRGATHIKYLRSGCQAGVKLKWSLLKNSTALQSFQ